MKKLSAIHCSIGLLLFVSSLWSGQVFNITQEGNNLTEWTVNDGVNGGTRAASSASAMANTNYGISFVFTNGGSGRTNYCYKDFTLLTSTEYGYRFYVDPNSCTGAGDVFTNIASTYRNTATAHWGTLVEVNYYSSVPKYNMNVGVYTDASAFTWTTEYDITDAPHCIEVHVIKSTGSAAPDAHLKVYVDGTLAEDKTGFILWNNFAVDRLYAGCGYADRMSLFGTMYLDEFVFRDDGVMIGPAGALSPPSVSVTSPASGNSWKVNSSHNITWTATDNVSVAACTLFYSINAGTNWTKITDLTGAGGSFAWTVPLVTASSQCQIKVRAKDGDGNVGEGTSATFSIANAIPTVSVTSPQASDTYTQGGIHNIVWTCSDDGSVKACTLFYSIDNGASWAKVKDTASTAITGGTYAWTIPAVMGTQAKVKVKAVDNDGNTGEGTSGVFSIIAPVIPTVTLTKPNGGEKWPARSKQTITWNTNSAHTTRAIFYKQGTGLWTRLDSTAGALGANSWDWTVSSQVGAGCYVKVELYNTSGTSIAKDSSNEPFEITKAPFFTSPDSVRVAVNGYYEYNVEVDVAGSMSSPALTFLSGGPSWAVFFGNKVVISAPSTAVTDTAQIEMAIDGYKDTLDLRIIVYDPSTIVKGLEPSLLSGSQFFIEARFHAPNTIRFTFVAEKAGEANLRVFDIKGCKVWEQGFNVNHKGYQIMERNFGQEGIALRQGFYTAILKQNHERNIKRFLVLW